MELLYSSALRLNELVQLDVADLDLTGRQVRGTRQGQQGAHRTGGLLRDRGDPGLDADSAPHYQKR